jgi:hypothetical protein
MDLWRERLGWCALGAAIMCAVAALVNYCS